LQRRRRILALCVGIGLLAAAPHTFADSETRSADTADAPDTPEGQRPVVIVLSLDGVRHDYPDLRDYPALTRMAREGVRAKSLEPVFPSSTFPNHVSLATGAHPDRHGIVENEFYDRVREEEYSYESDASWLEAEPLWVTAERQGVRAAAFFWVGSETDWNGKRATYRITPFDRAIDETAKVDQILAWLDLPDRERPQLIMTWWRGTDRMGHRKGPEHADIADALALQDVSLARLLAQLDERGAWPHTTVIVVSDHGMTLADQPVDIESPIETAGIAARIVALGNTAHFFLDDPSQLERAEKILKAVPNAQIYRRDDVPQELRYRHASRTGDLVAIAEAPHFFRKGGAVGSVEDSGREVLGWHRGGHGYSPDLPDMSGILFAMGRGIDPNRELGRARTIDVAPTVAVLLGIDAPRQAEGTPLFERPVARPVSDARP
jgi:predicted AlkP superfamily pyrophosphatase or phosphodiesterase